MNKQYQQSCTSLTTPAFRHPFKGGEADIQFKALDSPPPEGCPQGGVVLHSADDPSYKAHNNISKMPIEPE
jgi:hypothetical protein